MTTTKDGACAPGRIDLSGAAGETFDAFVRAMKERAAAGLRRPG